MKLSKAELAAVIITVVFIALTVVYSLPALSGRADVTISEQSPAASGSSAEGASPAQESAPSSLININTASADELGALPGIGEKLAQSIVAYREKNGPFTSTEGIQGVSGIGSKTYEAIKSLITTD